MGKKIYCNLCGKDFWKGFFSPRCPGVYIILGILFLNIIYTCVCVLMSTYFNNFSKIQHFGYFTAFIANSVSILMGILTIAFLTKKPEKMTRNYCIFIHVGLLLAFLCGIITLVLMFLTPNLSEVKEHTKRHVSVYHRAPYMMGHIFQEKKCCGIQAYGDIFKELRHKINPKLTSCNRTDDFSERIRRSELREDNEDEPRNSALGVAKVICKYYRVPSACCRHLDTVVKITILKTGSGKSVAVKTTCEQWTLEFLPKEEYMQKKHHLFSDPCFQPGENFSILYGTETYKTYVKTVLATLTMNVFIFGILGVLSYYVWYRFERMPKEHRPDKFIKQWSICNKFKKKRGSTETEDTMEWPNGKNKKQSSFEFRHQKIMQSLASMRTLGREIRQKEQMDRQISGAMSKSQTGLVASPSVSRFLTTSPSTTSRHILAPPKESQA